MKSKSMTLVEKEVKIKCVRSDRGGELTFEEFKNLCDKSGIKKTAYCTIYSTTEWCSREK